MKPITLVDRVTKVAARAIVLFQVTWDDLGMLRSHDLKENGENIPVTASNKEEYVELYAKFLLVDSVYRQFEWFKQGFMRVMGDTASISLLR